MRYGFSSSRPDATSLLALPRLLTDDAYRASLMRHVDNPVVIDFFLNTYNKWTPSFREEAISPVLNKCRAFLTDPVVRNTIGHPRSSFNFRWMMDHRKILLCNLAKGSIGGDNSRLLGSLIVLQEKLAALSRQDTPEPDRVPHVLYVDEAANFIGDFESILSETRKYGLILTPAFQNLESLPRETVMAIFSNCATVISFRVSGADAGHISNEFGLAIPASSLQDLPDYTMYLRTLTRSNKDAGASPSGPHRVKAHPPFDRHPHHAWRKSTVQVSQARFAMSRAIIEEKLRRDFFDAA